MPDRTFDWRPSTDPRNDEHLSRPLLATNIPRRSTDWAGPYVRLDQGRDGACVGFGWTTEYMSTPVRGRPAGYAAAKAAGKVDVANRFAMARYHEAQLVDEFADTPPAEGSSVNGGAKAMRAKGYITAWKWHRSVDDVIDALITDGPQVMGSNWLDGMFNADTHGIIRATGSVAGGHCYCLTGYRTRYYGVECVRLRNSWGSWALNGDAFLPVDDLRALWSDGAECAMPVGRSLGT